MARLVPVRSLAAISAAGCFAAPAAAQWSATILHPPGAYSSSVQALAPGQQAGTVQLSSLASTGNAALWNGTAGSWSSLGQGFAAIYGTTGAQQVGQFNGHASLWSGTPASRVDLHPSVAAGSVAYSVDATRQVGYAFVGGEYHAALWSGSAASYVDLHPTGATNSLAYATDGARQWGGVDYPGPGGQISRGGYWTGTAASFTSLNPGPAWSSSIRAMGGGQQAGYTWIPGMQQPHATIWKGTAESWQDLHPLPGSGSSYLYATTGTMQVGSSHVAGFSFPHAGVWSGTASSFIDLSQFLPAAYGGDSLATSIIVDGGITYVGGYARGPSGQNKAVLWTLVPAPPSIIALLGFALPARRRRRT